MKATLSEIKENPQGTNSEGKEARVQINNLEHKEKIKSTSTDEETRIQNKTKQKKLGENKKTLGRLQMCQNHRDARR